MCTNGSGRLDTALSLSQPNNAAYSALFPKWLTTHDPLASDLKYHKDNDLDVVLLYQTFNGMVSLGLYGKGFERF